MGNTPILKSLSTIAIYASSFLDGTEQVKPDLGLYTLSHFLDRFVYKMLNKTTNKRFIYYAAFGWCSYRIFVGPIY